RVAVRRRLADRGRSRKTGTVLHDHLLTPALAHVLSKDARQDIGDRTGAERHHNGHALVRPSLRRGRRRGYETGRHHGGRAEHKAQNPFHRFPPAVTHFASAADRSAEAAFLAATNSSRLLPKSLSMTAAAFRPGPPEIDPPGWVVEPV